MQICIKNDIQELRKVFAAAASYLAAQRIPEEEIRIIKLVLDEALSNIIKYAYSDQNTHLIQIDVEHLDNLIHLKIVDDGREFNPLTVPDPNPNAVASSQPGGLGILILKKMVDQIEYDRSNGKNILRINKSIQSSI